MRSSKSRSRSKSNRPRSLGNIVNRVFDSSGPEGKVRGTPAQIIEKYLFLARDAQLSNDRVAAENFLQHAEHYTRLLGEAQREMAIEQENRRSDHQPGQGQGGQPQQGNHRSDRPRDDRRDDRQDQPRAEREPRAEHRPEPQPAPQPGQDAAAASHEVIDLSENADEESGLVETPETRHRHRPAPRRRPEQPVPAPQADTQSEAAAPAPAGEAQPEAPAAETAPEQPKAERPRRPRGPRKPKSPDGDGSPDGGPREAAE